MVASIDVLRLRTLERIFRGTQLIRVCGTFLLAALFAGLAIVEPSPARLVVLSALSCTVALLTLVERRMTRHRRVAPWARNVIIGCLGAFQLSALFLVGGVDSPLLVAILPFSLISWLIAARRFGRVVLGIQLLALWTYVVARVALTQTPPVPLGLGGPIVAEDVVARSIATAIVLSGMLLGARRMMRYVAEAFEATFAQTLAARDEALTAYGEQTRTLTALSAEIAHELKNPLASIKGLSAMVAKGLEGKAGERMDVLRREVDRMQGILEELLNFTRPLVPLTLEDVDLGSIAAEVARLHEGMAIEQGATLEVSVEPAPLRCDPRKVKQILVNLLQNALQASPAGSRVAMSVSRTSAGEAVARIEDEGPGLALDVAASAFDPGVTTKHEGMGLGLTISRALARQHGGDVTVVPGEGGGAVAVLQLPPRPPLPGAAPEEPG